MRTPSYLAETGQQHCADRDVDSDAQSVGTADHLEKPVLRENFDEPSVLGQHASMVNADAVPDQARECLSEPRGEAETAQRFGDRFLLGLGTEVDARQCLGALERGRLREMHDVDRGLVGGHQIFDGFADRRGRVREHQRHRAFRAGDDGGRLPGATRQILGEEVDLTESCRHQEELRVRQLDERNLPRPTSIGFGVEMELVHHDLADIGVRALSQCEIRDDLCRRTNDRRRRVHGGVAGHHADVLGSEDFTQRKELLAHQGLDRRCVIGALAERHRIEMRADRYHRFAGPGRRRKDHVCTRDQLHDGLFLGRIERQTSFEGPRREGGRKRNQDPRCRGEVPSAALVQASRNRGSGCASLVGAHGVVALPCGWTTFR